MVINFFWSPFFCSLFLAKKNELFGNLYLKIVINWFVKFNIFVYIEATTKEFKTEPMTSGGGGDFISLTFFCCQISKALTPSCGKETQSSSWLGQSLHSWQQYNYLQKSETIKLHIFVLGTKPPLIVQVGTFLLWVKPPFLMRAYLKDDERNEPT